MKVQLKLNEQQLDVLLSQIEATLAQALPGEQQARSPELAQAALRLPPNESSYDIAMLAPVYLQLVGHSRGLGAPAAAVYGPDEQLAWARSSMLLEVANA